MECCIVCAMWSIQSIALLCENRPRSPSIIQREASACSAYALALISITFEVEIILNCNFSNNFFYRDILHLFCLSILQFRLIFVRDKFESIATETHRLLYIVCNINYIAYGALPLQAVYHYFVHFTQPSIKNGQCAIAIQFIIEIIERTIRSMSSKNAHACFDHHKASK